MSDDINVTAIAMFSAFVLMTLYITYWAAKKMTGTKNFYSAGGNITGFQNYMSAASFLGISGLVFAAGFDGLIYSIGFLVGWPIILLLIAEPLRNLGKYTFSDVACYRLKQKPTRILAACGTLATVTLYLIAQMVGSGKLIQVLFGLDYTYAVIIVGALMMVYVTFGGMIATTWVQIIKAVLLLFGASMLAFLVLMHFNFSIEELFGAAIEKHANGDSIMAPGGLVSDPISAISLGLALMFGTAGLPHILMRFFTVPNAKEAHKSVFYATGFIGYFYILTFIIGFGAIAFLLGNPDFISEDGTLIGGNNMAAIQLSEALGGDLLLGFISAVAFATILAVVSGLTLAGASAISHDLYANVFAGEGYDEKKELNISRYATIGLGITAIILGIVFEQQNVAFMVGLAFSIAASANFPILFLSMYWKNLTTRGAVIGGFSGLFTAVILVILGPIVWVDVFGNDSAIFPYKYPALFSMSVAFIGIWLFSVTDRSKSAKEEKEAFNVQYFRSQTGIGAEKASKH